MTTNNKFKPGELYFHINNGIIICYLEAMEPMAETGHCAKIIMGNKVCTMTIYEHTWYPLNDGKNVEYYRLLFDK